MVPSRVNVAPGLRHWSQRGSDVPEEVPRLRGLQSQLHPTRFDLGEVENIVDQCREMHAGAVNPFDVRRELGGVDTVFDALLDQLTVALDGVQRVSKLVGQARQVVGDRLVADQQLTALDLHGDGPTTGPFGVDGRCAQASDDHQDQAHREGVQDDARVLVQPKSREGQLM